MSPSVEPSIDVTTTEATAQCLAADAFLAEQLTTQLRQDNPLAAEWEVEVLSSKPGHVKLRLPFRASLQRSGGGASSPALMGLADAAMWAALASSPDTRDEKLASNLSITFLRPATPGALVAEARIVKRGARLSYGEVWLCSEADASKPVAHVTTSWAGLN